MDGDILVWAHGATSHTAQGGQVSYNHVKPYTGEDYAS